jgi:hypothetical protein
MSCAHNELPADGEADAVRCPDNGATCCGTLGNCSPHGASIKVPTAFQQ